MILQNLNDKISNFLITNQTMDKLNFPSLKDNITVYEMLLRNNTVLRRFIDRNQKDDFYIPKELLIISNREMKRINDALNMINTLSKLCNHNNIPFVMTKAFQHFPDMGHDIDLLIMDKNSSLENILKKQFEYKRRPISLSSYIAGKHAYLLSVCESPIEIHNNRLGHFGEYKKYAKKVIDRRMPFTFNGNSTFIPSIEDQLIIQCIQRVYGHRTVRISDVIQVSKLVNNSSFDWEYTRSAISANGIQPGFEHYMSVVNNLCKKWNVETIDSHRYIYQVIKNNNLTMPDFNGSVYKTTSLSDLGILYIKIYLFNIFHMQWDSIFRLSFLPLVALLNGVRNILKRNYR